MTTVTSNGLTAGTWVVLLTSVGLATTGQLLLKSGMDRVGELNVGQVGTLISQVFTTWQLIFGLLVFGMSSIFWLITLSRVPLSTAYPIVSLSYVLILSLSWLLLGERPGITVWLGALLIMGGVSLIGLGQR